MVRSYVYRLMMVVWMCSWVPMVQAEEYHDQAALSGITETKVIYDMRKANPQMMLVYLRIIEQEHDAFKKNNINAHERMIFIADAVKYITTKPSAEVEMEYGDLLPQIRQQITRLLELGVKMEVCSMATAAFGVDNATLVPGMTLVRSGFMSLIGWQQKGYQLVPIYN